MSDSPDTYAFHAFISYRRGEKDEECARWLQRRLEAFRIPAAARVSEVEQARPPQSGRFKVFRDKSDLGAHPSVAEGLHRSLDQCRYLIVICSPRSAASAYVDQEVRRFIEQGRTEYVIPFIVDGQPAPGSGRADNCYPESLPGSVLGVTLSEGTREEALIKTVARLLRVDYHTLYQRHLRAQRRFMMRALFAVAAVLVAVTGLALWALDAEQRATAQRREAENLVRFMTFDMRDEAFNYIPLKAREAITRRVEKYYEKWGGSPETAHQRAMHLGNEATHAFERNDLAKSEELARQALELLRPLRAAAPDDVELLRAETFVLGRLGICRHFAGDAPQALRLCSQALDGTKALLRLRPDDPEALRLAGNVHGILSSLLAGGDRGAAREHAKEAVGIFHRLHTQAPDNRYVHLFADALESLCRRSIGTPDSDPATCAEAVDLARLWRDGDPGNFAAAIRLVHSLETSARLWMEADPDKAAALLDEASALLADLEQRDRDNVGWRTAAIKQKALGAFLRFARTGNPDDPEGRTLLAEAEQRLEAEKRAGDRGADLEEAERLLGQVREFAARQQRYNRGGPELAESARKAEEAHARQPENAETAGRYVDELLNAGASLYAGHEFDKALPYFEKAEPALLGLIRQKPDDERLRQVLVGCYIRMADARSALGDTEGFGRAARRALEAARQAMETFPGSARLLRGASEAADCLARAAYESGNMAAYREANLLSAHLARKAMAGKLQGRAERKRLALSLSHLAESQRLNGDYKQAEESLAEARKLLDETAAKSGGEEPEDARLSRANLVFAAAELAGDLGRTDEALELSATARKASGDAPRTRGYLPGWRFINAAGYAQAAFVLLERGEPAKALENAMAAENFGGIDRKESAEMSAELPYQYRWPYLQARALIALKRTEEAIPLLALGHESAASGQDNGKSALNRLAAAALQGLEAELALASGNARQAVAQYEKALAASGEPAARDDSGVTAKPLYAELLAGRAEARIREKHYVEALEDYRRAVGIGQALYALEPRQIHWRKKLLRALEGAEQAALALNRKDEAKEYRDTLQKLEAAE